MMRSVVTSVVLAGVLLCASPAHSHHSNVAYEVTKVITITGDVKEFRWVNPHTWLHVMVDDGKGAKVEWQVEGRAPGVLLRAGWTKTSLDAWREGHRRHEPGQGRHQGRDHRQGDQGRRHHPVQPAGAPVEVEGQSGKGEECRMLVGAAIASAAR